MLVGAFEEATFTSNTCFLAPGDILVFYTDGITETDAEDSSDEINVHADATLMDMLYGQERLAACVSANAGLSASALCEAIVEDLALFSGSTESHDDRALVVVKRDT